MLSLKSTILIATLLVIITSILAFIFIVGSRGVENSEIRIALINDYEFVDIGGYEKMILYVGEDRKKGIVVDARVDNYLIQDDQLLVSRTPRVSVLEEDGITRSRLTDECEYLRINTKTHVVVKNNDNDTTSLVECDFKGK